MNIATARLQSQHLAAAPFDRAADVVRWMGAIQAQDYGQALWAIGARMASGTTIRDIEQAIGEGQILRTWPMRGTMHFVAAEDARWMLQLSAARMIAADQRRLDQLGLDAATMERSRQLFHDALSGGRRVSRPDLMALLEQHGIATQSGRGYHLLWHAAQSGLICVGPMAGKQQTFALLDDWAPQPRELPRDQALAELAVRYFTSRGPATLADFRWWSGLTAADTRAGHAAAQSRLVRETIAGADYWLAPAVGPAAAAPSPPRPAAAPLATTDPATTPLLLAGFDEYLLGYQDRTAVLDPAHAGQVIPGGNGVFQPIMVSDGHVAPIGQVIGTWKRTIKKTGVDVSLQPFVPVPTNLPDFQPAIDRYRAFMTG
jgi:hypothetical protein